MILLGIALAGASVAMLFWIVHDNLTRAWCKYRDTLNSEAETKLAEMFVFIDLSSVWPVLIVLSGALGLSLWIMSDSFALSVGLASCLLVIPRLALTKARKNRLRKLDQQLPDTLRMLASALGSGISFSSALNTIASDLSPPLSQELALIMREQRVGIQLQTALDNFRARADTDSVGQVTTLLRVGAKSGSSFAGLLDQLAGNLAAQQRVSSKVDMLTAQARVQARVIGVLPLLLLFVLCWIDMETMRIAFGSDVGKCLLSMILLLEIVGIVWLRAILRRVTT